jgi:hypothetical protein
MSRMMRVSISSLSSTGNASMVEPSRMTVTVSAIARISLSLWEMMIDVMPCPRRCLIRSSSGRFVEDEQLDALGQGLRDLDELLLADAELEHFGRRVLLQTDARDQLGRLGVRLVPVDDAGARILVAEEDVLGDRQVGAEGELLVDDHDPVALAVVDRPVGHLLALEGDRAVERPVRVDPAQHLHQSGLPRAVLAADGVHLAALHLEVDAVERLHAAEVLHDALHREYGVVHACPSLDGPRSAPAAKPTPIGVW